MTADDRVDVAIVGCGPVGGVLATLLGQRGHRVVVLERHHARYPLPRAVHFDHEVARLLQGCGLGPDLTSISEPGDVYEWRNGSGQVLLRFGGGAVGPSGWPAANMFTQPTLEGLIEGAAAGQPTVEVRRGAQVVGVDQDGEGVTVTVDAVDTATAAAGGGASPHLRAQYVVGCDGANSTLRDLVGAGVTDLGFFYDWLIVDVVLTEPREFDPVNLQVCDPERPTTAVSGGPGRRRWEFMRLPHESLDELHDVDRAWELLAPWAITPEHATLERHAVYRFQARWVDRWRVDRVLLAGDAAHQMPPFAGQGMCSGVRDAANLAWKLDLVLAGRAPEGLLDAYERERVDNVRAVIDLSMALGQVICVSDPDEAIRRDDDMARAASETGAQPYPPLPGITAGIIAPDDALAGQLFVQGRVTVGGDTALLDDVIGPGWHLVAVDRRVELSLPDHLRAWFSDLGGRVVTVGGPGDDDDHLTDADGTYGEWFARHSVAAALQRPDLHLFGASPDPQGAGELLDALRTALARPLVPSAPDAHGGPT